MPDALEVKSVRRNKKKADDTGRGDQTAADWKGEQVMIHPSYVELMQVVNTDQTEIGEEPVINSRYSIVIATAKRARQIIGGDEPMITKSAGRKPLSVAVQELYEGKVKIVGEDDMADSVKESRELAENKESSELNQMPENSELVPEQAEI